MRGGEGGPFQKGSPSPPRAPPLPSENFCQGHRRDDAARQPPAVSSVPRQHTRRTRRTTAKKSPPAGCAGAFFYEGERETVLENGFPLPLALPHSFPKTFTRVHVGQSGPARRRVTVLSPGGMKKRPDSKKRPASLYRVWLACGLASCWMLRRLTSGQITFLGGWGVWGKGPFVHKGALPPTQKNYACSPARAARMRQTPQVSPEEVG